MTSLQTTNRQDSFVMSPQQGNDIRNAQVYRVWATYLTMGMLLALFLPSDIVSSVPLLGSFTTFMSSLIPSIEKITSVSAFPEVTRTYFSVMWAGQPMVTAFMMLRLRYDPIKVVPIPKLIGILLLAVPLFGLLLYVFYAFPGVVKVDHSYTSGRGKAFFTLMSNYRFMLGLIGSVVISTSMTLLYWLFMAYPRTFIYQFTRKEQS